jgi:hypothetical protein
LLPGTSLNGKFDKALLCSNVEGGGVGQKFQVPEHSMTTFNQCCFPEEVIVFCKFGRHSIRTSTWRFTIKYLIMETNIDEFSKIILPEKIEPTATFDIVST